MITNKCIYYIVSISILSGINYLQFNIEAIVKIIKTFLVFKNELSDS